MFQGGKDEAATGLLLLVEIAATVVEPVTKYSSAGVQEGVLLQGEDIIKTSREASSNTRAPTTTTTTTEVVMVEAVEGAVVVSTPLATEEVEVAIEAAVAKEGRLLANLHQLLLQ
jgi:hypothetical protein